MYVRLLLITLGLWMAAPASTYAADKEPAELHVAHGWAREGIGASPNGVAFVVIHNPTEQDDRLVEITSVSAKRIEIHTHEMSKDGVMSMVNVGELMIPSGAHIEFKPGGLHLMLLNIDQPLEAGSHLSLTFKFDLAGDVDVEIPILTLMESTERTNNEHSHNEHHKE